MGGICGTPLGYNLAIKCTQGALRDPGLCCGTALRFRHGFKICVEGWGLKPWALCECAFSTSSEIMEVFKYPEAW